MMKTNSDYETLESKMKKTLVAWVKFQCVRAGRANHMFLDKITVDYYGSQSPLCGC